MRLCVGIVVLLLSLAVGLSLSGAQLIAPPGRAQFNPAHPLAQQLAVWHLALPHLRGGTAWYDVRTNKTGVLTNMGPGEGFQPGPKRLETTYGLQVRLDGVDDYVDFGDDSYFDFPFQTITIMARFWSNLSSGSGYLVAKRNPDGPNGGYFLRLNAPAGTITVRISNSDNALVGQIASATAGLNDGQWHTVTAILTFDTDTLANNNVTLYINGVQDGATMTQDPTHGYNACICPFVYGVQSNLANFLPGGIDDIRIWTRALSPREIWEAHVAGPPTFGGLFESPPLVGKTSMSPVKRRVVIQ